MSVSAMFVELQGALTADQDIREVRAGPGRGAVGGGRRAEPRRRCVSAGDPEGRAGAGADGPRDADAAAGGAPRERIPGQ